MSDMRTNEQLVKDVYSFDYDAIAEVDYLTREAENALAELLRRANEAALYKRALEEELTDLTSFPCASMSLNLIRDIKEHRTCPLGRDIAECWMLIDEAVKATDKRPVHPSCAMKVSLDRAQQMLTKSDKRTNKHLQGTAAFGLPSKRIMDKIAGREALDELVRRADDGEKLRELANAAHVVARMYSETLCQGNEGMEFLDAVDAVFPKEAEE